MSKADFGPVVHICNSVETAQNEITALMRGERIMPSCGLGSHTTSSELRKPVAVLVGGKFTDEEIEVVRQHSDEARMIPWFTADKSVTPPGGWPPKPDYARERMIKSLEEHGITADGQGVGKDQVWLW